MKQICQKCFLQTYAEDMRGQYCTACDPDRLPETYEQAVNYLAARLDLETLNNPFYHFSTGMNIRNTLGLWSKTNKLYQYMLSRFGLGHADDTCGLLTAAVKAKLTNSDFDPYEEAHYYIDFWESQGINPATLEKI